ncbi:MAG TPA: hypothetical protein VKV95_15120 [Terriglobia bacterium]|nr:hypothetical protein [Terriglobia bacterium]
MNDVSSPESATYPNTGLTSHLSDPPLKPLGEWGSALRQVFSFPALLLTLLITTVFVMGRNGLSDPDIWWHLRNAEYLLANHRFIRVDMYSFTLAGHPWVNPEWLGEIPYYLAWRAGGLVGIKLVMLVSLAVIFLGLLYLCNKSSGNPKAAALACYFAVFLAVVNFGPRTILFGYCFLVMLLIILERFRSCGKGPLWILPPLFCLWTNTHGSWLIGLVVFGLIVAAGFVEGRWGRIEARRWSAKQSRNLMLAMGGSLAAALVNPYGLGLILWSIEYPFRLKLNVEHVQEWTSVNFHDPRGKVALLLIIALLLGALLRDYRWQLTELVLVLFALYTGLTHIRFLFLAAILTAPLLAKFLDFVPPYQPEIDKHVLNALLMAGMTAFIFYGFPSSAQLQESIENEYPAEILPYLSSHPPSGPVLNDYLWGGYLGWEDRNFKCFIDSRVDIFEYAGVFKDYLDLVGIQNPNAVLDKYGIRYVLFPPTEELSYVLRRDPGWKVVYSGKISTLFERVGNPPPAKAGNSSGVQGM